MAYYFLKKEFTLAPYDAKYTVKNETDIITLSLHPYLFELIVKESLRRRKKWAPLVQDILYQHLLGKIEMICDKYDIPINKITKSGKNLDKPICISREASLLLRGQAKVQGMPYRTYLVFIVAQWFGWYRDDSKRGAE